MSIAVFVNSCELDNYDSPDSALYGQAIDAETGEPIPQALVDGSVVEIKQLDYDNPNSRRLRFKTDGSYRNTQIFKGRYYIHGGEGNFYEDEGDTLKVSGETEYNISVIPYIRILNENITFDPVKGMVTAKFNIKSDEVVKNIALICDKNPNVCWGLRSFTAQSGINKAVDESDTLTLVFNSQNIEEDGDYYFRICALAATAPNNMYNYTIPVKMTIDNSQIVPEPEPEGVYLDNCETIDGWGSGIGSPQLSVDAKEGLASVEFNGNLSGVVMFQKVYDTPVNSGVTMGNGVLSLYLYVSDAAPFADSNGQLEITSSGGCDVNEVHWEFKDMDLHSGWNKLQLPLREGSNSGIDLTKVNYIRAYSPGSADVTVRIDGVQFITVPNVLFNCDSNDGWGTSCSNGITVDSADKKEGEACLSATGTFNDVLFMRKLEDPINAGCDANGGITFWLYIGDASVLPPTGDHQIELSSGPGDDTGEFGWRLTADDWSNLHSGWNKITLPISKADSQANPDSHNIRWFRIYMIGLGGETTFKIDDIEAY